MLLPQCMCVWSLSRHSLITDTQILSSCIGLDRMRSTIDLDNVLMIKFDKSEKIDGLISNFGYSNFDSFIVKIEEK
jgi:hypothetical protein